MKLTTKNMATKTKTKEEVRQEQVETSVSKFEQFYEKYKLGSFRVLFQPLSSASSRNSDPWREGGEADVRDTRPDSP